MLMLLKYITEYKSISCELTAKMSMLSSNSNANVKTQVGMGVKPILKATLRSSTDWCRTWGRIWPPTTASQCIFH
jgi:hypothetical protein